VDYTDHEAILTVKRLDPRPTAADAYRDAPDAGAPYRAYWPWEKLGGTPWHDGDALTPTLVASPAHGLVFPSPKAYASALAAAGGDPVALAAAQGLAADGGYYYVPTGSYVPDDTFTFTENEMIGGHSVASNVATATVHYAPLLARDHAETLEPGQGFDSGNLGGDDYYYLGGGRVEWAEPDADMPAAPTVGSSNQLLWTAPDEPGVYRYAYRLVNGQRASNWASVVFTVFAFGGEEDPQPWLTPPTDRAMDGHPLVFRFAHTPANATAAWRSPDWWGQVSTNATAFFANADGSPILGPDGHPATTITVGGSQVRLADGGNGWPAHTHQGISLLAPAGFVGQVPFTLVFGAYAGDGTPVVQSDAQPYVCDVWDRLPAAGAPGAVTAYAGASVKVQLAAADADGEPVSWALAETGGQALTAGGATTAAGGTVALTAGGAVTYTPPADFIGTDYVYYALSDGSGPAVPCVLTVTVAQPGATVAVPAGTTLVIGDGAGGGGAGGAEAFAGATIANAGTVEVAGAASVGAVTGPGSTVVDAGASLTLDRIAQGSLTIHGTAGDPGRVTLRASGAADGSGTVSINVLGTLALDNDGGALGSRTYYGVLDLADNNLIVSGATIAAVEDMVRAGTNGFVFGGPGITSADAGQGTLAGYVGLGVMENLADPTDPSAGPILSSFDGAPLSGGEIIVKFTWFGDANLDGYVTADDLAFLQAGFGGAVESHGKPGWLYGDFDGNGVVDSTDLAFFQAGVDGSNSGTVGLP
jgi:hypothetical protein